MEELVRLAVEASSALETAEERLRRFRAELARHLRTIPRADRRGEIARIRTAVSSALKKRGLKGPAVSRRLSRLGLGIRRNRRHSIRPPARWAGEAERLAGELSEKYGADAVAFATSILKALRRLKNKK